MPVRASPLQIRKSPQNKTDERQEKPEKWR
jgi:hypothetical protein